MDVEGTDPFPAEIPPPRLPLLFSCVRISGHFLFSFACNILQNMPFLGPRRRRKMLPPLLLVLFLAPGRANRQQCPSPVFRSQRSSTASNGSMPLHPVPYHFFAITQDCQFVLARPDQLNQFPSLRVSTFASPSDCHPSRVQLLWSLAGPVPSLLLLQKRAGRQLCVLPVEMPNPVAVYGKEVFSYSLRNALKQFARCFTPNATTLDPNLAFADSLYSDVLYFLPSAAPSSQSKWSLRQFQLSPTGHLHPLDSLEVQQMLAARKSAQQQPKGDESPILLTADPQRKRLFALEREGAGEAVWTCPFDLLFRPHLTKLHRILLFPVPSPAPSPAAAHFRPTNSLLSGFSLDRNVAIFTETRKSSTETLVFLAKLHSNAAADNGTQTAETRCVLKLAYAAKFGVISAQTLTELGQKGALPQLGERLRGMRPTDGNASVEAVRAPLVKPTVGTATTAAPTKTTTTERALSPTTTSAAGRESPRTSTTGTTERTVRLESEDGEEEVPPEGGWSSDYDREEEEEEEGGTAKLKDQGPALIKERLSAGDRDVRANDTDDEVRKSAAHRLASLAAAWPVAIQILSLLIARFA